MKFTNILKATGGNEILAIVAELPVDKDGFFLSEEQLNKIEAALEASAGNADVITALNADKTKLTADLATATEASEKATADHAAATAKITEHEATISTLQTQATTDQQTIAKLTTAKSALETKVEELGKEDGKTFTTAIADKDKIEDKDAVADANELPFQKAIYEKLNS
jgi:chromosome segregation ATPase